MRTSLLFIYLDEVYIISIEKSNSHLYEIKGLIYLWQLREYLKIKSQVPTSWGIFTEQEIWYRESQPKLGEEYILIKKNLTLYLHWCKLPPYLWRAGGYILSLTFQFRPPKWFFGKIKNGWQWPNGALEKKV